MENISEVPFFNQPRSERASVQLIYRRRCEALLEGASEAGSKSGHNGAGFVSQGHPARGSGLLCPCLRLLGPG